MGIDIMGLQVPQAVLSRPQSGPQSYKIDSTKAKSILDDPGARSTDLLSASGQSAEKLAAVVRNGGGSVRRISNYSTEAFFHRDMPSVANEDGTYTVSGVSFTAEELVQARSVLQAAADSIAAGPGRNVNLDYRNYAQMEIACRGVDIYASDNLNADQQKVVNQAMRDYNDGLMELQDRVLGSSRTADPSGYYTLAEPLTQDIADALNAFKAELSNITGRTYRPSRAGETGGLQQVAANQNLIRSLSSLFRDADLGTQVGRQTAFDSYARLVRPAYLAQGVSAGDIAGVTFRDAQSLSSGLDAILSAARQHFELQI